MSGRWPGRDRRDRYQHPTLTLAPAPSCQARAHSAHDNSLQRITHQEIVHPIRWMPTLAERGGDLRQVAGVASLCT